MFRKRDALEVRVENVQRIFGEIYELAITNSYDIDECIQSLLFLIEDAQVKALSLKVTNVAGTVLGDKDDNAERSPVRQNAEIH